MLTDDLFLARELFPQASLVSSVGLWRQTHCRLPALAASSIGLSRTGFDFTMHSFLANVNSRSLFSVAVRLSVVCNVRAPYSDGSNFGNISTALCTLAID